MGRLGGGDWVGEIGGERLGGGDGANGWGLRGDCVWKIGWGRLDVGDVGDWVWEMGEIWSGRLG